MISASYYKDLDCKELVQLLDVVGLPKSGVKADLVSRLAQHPVASRYHIFFVYSLTHSSSHCYLTHDRKACTSNQMGSHDNSCLSTNVPVRYKDAGRAGIVTHKWVESHYRLGDADSPMPGSREGPMLGDLKTECGAAGLKVSGTRFDLTLRLLQLHMGGPAIAGSKKRTMEPGVDAAGADRPAKARKVSPPNISKLVQRVNNAVFADQSKWSVNKWKQHTSNVFSLINKIITTELVETGLLIRRDPIALKVIDGLFGPYLEGGNIMNPGRGDWEMSETAASVVAVLQSCDDVAAIQRSAAWIREVGRRAADFGSQRWIPVLACLDSLLPGAPAPAGPVSADLDLPLAQPAL